MDKREAGEQGRFHRRPRLRDHVPNKASGEGLRGRTTDRNVGAGSAPATGRKPSWTSVFSGVSGSNYSSRCGLVVGT